MNMHDLLTRLADEIAKMREEAYECGEPFYVSAEVADRWEWQLRQAAATDDRRPVDGWISVEDALPDDANEEVIVWRKYDRRRTGRRSEPWTADTSCWDGGEWLFGAMTNHVQVTHWRHMPAGPGITPPTARPEVEAGRFGHHPDPAIDFEIEVESLQGRLFNARHGIAKMGEQPESIGTVREAIAKAMEFRVGGDPSACRAKQMLRALSDESTQGQACTATELDAAAKMIYSFEWTHPFEEARKEVQDIYRYKARKLIDLIQPLSQIQLATIRKWMAKADDLGFFNVGEALDSLATAPKPAGCEAVGYVN